MILAIVLLLASTPAKKPPQVQPLEVGEATYWAKLDKANQALEEYENISCHDSGFVADTKAMKAAAVELRNAFLNIPVNEDGGYVKIMESYIGFRSLLEQGIEEQESCLGEDDGIQPSR